MINFMPLAEHDSWLSMDLLWGCPNDCGYCYLRNSGLARVKPQIRFPLDNRLRDELISVLKDCPGDVPVSIGNYTDMLANEDNRNMLYDIANCIARIDPQRLIVITTKSIVSETVAKRIAEATSGRGLMILSQSFSKDYSEKVEKGAISSSYETYKSFETIAKIEGLNAIHFWRPFLAAWNPASDIFARIKNLMNSGSPCSIVIGLKGNEQLIDTYSDELKIWAKEETGLDGAYGDERIASGRLMDLLYISKEAGYPVFRQTSCAIAFMQHSPDINGTSISNIKSTHCESVNCPQEQRLICGNDPLLDVTEIPVLDEINEFGYNHLIHVYHKVPAVSKVHMQKVWRGSLMNDKC